MESRPLSESSPPETELGNRGVFRDSENSLPIQPAEESLNSDSSWVLIYIDIMTLLLTMFVLMLAYAKTDMDKFHTASEAMTQAARPNDSVINLGASSRESILSQQLYRSIAESGMQDNIDVLAKQGSVELRMKEKILFDSGAAQLRPDGETLLAKLIPLLRKDRYFITVEGHTDNIPIATDRYPTNWELSTARASQVVRFLISQGIAPQHTRAAGYADTRPIAKNTTEDGRSQNRRVSLIIEIKH
jgi:chemotaxis protein MotB